MGPINATKKATRRRVKSSLAYFKLGVYRMQHRTEIWCNEPSDRMHQTVIPLATYSPWLTDPDFLGLFNATQANTLVDLFRCYELWTLARQAHKVEGDILEVGVWRGGSGAILAKAVQQQGKMVYLADTFEGVVKAGENDPKYFGGEHGDTSVAIVRTLLASLSIENYELLVGIFPEDTSREVRGKLCMVHVDVDVYQSAKDIVDWCLPRLSIGSLIVFDDYGFSGCEGVALLCEELAERDDFIFLHNLNGHAVLVKIS